MINFEKIEKKWQKQWGKERVYKNYKRPKKFYVLDMFPYPSGEGLHVGHPRGYIATDVYSRYKLMNGFSVLHPMGWDAFGLPAENYALKNKIHPRIAVQKNVKRFKEQLQMFGFIYDWDKEINTTDPNFYKWTQWIFLKLFENGLVYESFEPINWCPSCKTGLANEDLENGLCERCGSQVEKKPMRQWAIKMTAYADKLLKDLNLLDWPAPIIEQQKNWIGRSEGAIIKFKIADSEEMVEVFTTRIDTIFGCTYVVVAPEHRLMEKIENKELEISNVKDVLDYVKKARNKSDLDRTDLAKEKTGVEIKGIKVINPFNNREVPLFVADYVLGSYGTGAVMAVPAHDKRDFEFAKKYNLPIKKVIVSELQNVPRNILDISAGAQTEVIVESECFTEDGKLVNSGQYTGMRSDQARTEMAKEAKAKKFGDKKVNYKMRDWTFSRQRYWGEPFPLMFCDHCAQEIKSSKFKKGKFNKGELMNPGWISVSENKLPIKLPEVKSYEPTGTGESPLANIKNWVNTKCPKCGRSARRETNTMPQWAGSSWYYLAYLMRKGNKYQWDKKAIKQWVPVDLYVGGVEHATRHLLYARFWHKFLYDIKAVFHPEPFKKLANQGLILAEDGRKMSKRWGNVINPDDVIKTYGADSLRLYEMFIGPFNQAIAWNMDGLRGTSRLLQRIYAFAEKAKFAKTKKTDRNLERLMHQTVKKITEDISDLRFNTSISALMILFNEMEKVQAVSKEIFESFLKLLSPFAPHLSEEIWRNILKHKKSIHLESWPKYNKRLIIEDEFELVVQVSGKVKDKIRVSKGISQERAKEIVMASEKIKQYLDGKEIKRIIFVPDKLINIVI